LKTGSLEEGTRVMKKIIALSLILGSFLFAIPAQAANDVVFSATCDKTSYSVGEDVKVTLNVNAGAYASTLNVIDFKLKVSDPTVIQPVGTSPLTAGSIFSSIAMQSYSNGILSAVVFVNPDNKPTNRSGVIGTLTLKAQKNGQSVISYDSIKAAEENQELDYVSTTASSLTVTVGGGVIAQTTQTTSASSGTGTTTAATRTVTPQPGRATTGPKETLIFSLIAGTVLLVSLKFTKKNKLARKI
jgi:hypothetical protein